MNAVTTYHSPDNVLTEALVFESQARAASLKSTTLKNALYGSAALVGALLVGWAALTWADAQRLDPEVLAKALAHMPELRVAPIKIAEGGEVTLKPGGEVTLAPGAVVGIEPGAVVGIEPGATVKVTGLPKQQAPADTPKQQPLPDVSKQATTNSDGSVIQRSVTVFSTIPLGLNTSITTGWTFENGGGKKPINEFCYREVVKPNGHSERVDIARNRVVTQEARATVSNVDALEELRVVGGSDMMGKALDHLVGVQLPRVFEKHFKTPATVPPQGRLEKTPYLAFAMAVCAEQEIPLDLVTAAAIARRHGLKEEQD